MVHLVFTNPNFFDALYRSTHPVKIQFFRIFGLVFFFKWPHQISCCFHIVPAQVEVEKKDSDEEPMEMVVEKMVDEPEAEAEAEVDAEEKHVGPILVDKMAEDLRPMDTDKETVVESKCPEESIQEDCGSDIAPMQTDDQLKQVQQMFVALASDQNSAGIP